MDFDFDFLMRDTLNIDALIDNAREKQGLAR